MLIVHRPWRALALTVTALLTLAACMPGARPAAPVSQPPAAPPAAPAAGANPAWDAVVAAARREGRLLLSGPPGQLWRDALLSFQVDYPDIQVEYTGGNSRDFWPRVFQERQAGQYLWDLRVGGPDPQVFQARDEGVLAPVRPLLLLPDVVDESKWFGGFEGLYADRTQEYLPTFIAQAQPTAYVNRSLIPASELSTDAQLRDPRWRGKIAINDPRGGAGLGTLATLVVAFGEDYVRDLLSRQDLVVTGDNRQLAEWVVRGRYPIGIGVTDDELLYFERQGLRFDVKGLDPPRKLSLGFGGIQLLDRAPHPNAATVFINWLLSQPVQARIAQMLQFNSRRVDVPPANAETVLDVTRLADYVPHQYEAVLPQRQRAQQLAQELLK